MSRRAATADQTPKCGRCGGWGLEPDVSPAANCTGCGGIARPPAAPAVPNFLTKGAPSNG